MYRMGAAAACFISLTGSDGMDSSAIQIAVATDDGYACHLTVLLMSLFERSMSKPIDVHVLVPSQFQSRDKMADALGKYFARLIFHTVEVAAGLKLRPDTSDATYYRLLMGDTLPATLSRVIYLDCDMLVCGDLTPLWETVLGEATVAAVKDACFAPYRLGLPPSQPYFNAGRLVVDLTRWRRDEVGKNALEFAYSNPERLTYDDQCALNWILQDRWVQLPNKWNVQAFTLGEMKHGYFIYPKRLSRAAEDVKVVHFNQPGRPWTYLDEHPFKRDYLAFRARTAWRGERPKDRYPHNVIVKTLLRYAPALIPTYKYLRTYI